MSSNGRERNERKGVLPRQALRVLIDQGHITSSIEIPDRNIQPASIDLTLGDVAYRLRCSFLPGTSLVREKLSEYAMDEIDLTGKGAVLEQNRPYLIPLKERLRLPKGIRGRTNPRSSTGRLDVFTRVITDMGGHFDEVRDGYEGELFLEVVPMSFTIKVRTGITLNQLRLMSGIARLSDDELLDLSKRDPIIYPGDSSEPGDLAVVSDGLFLSVDLSGKSFVGYRAKKSTALLDLDLSNAYEVGDFWERVEPTSGKLILGAGEFYLLVSRERVRIPPDYAAEMAAYDPTSGELRTHYAGFFDPGFGDVSDGPAGNAGRARGPGARRPVLAGTRSAAVQAHVRADGRTTGRALWRGDRLALSTPEARARASIPRGTDGDPACGPSSEGEPVATAALGRHTGGAASGHRAGVSRWR